jgi:hypothetical protein
MNVKPKVFGLIPALQMEPKLRSSLGRKTIYNRFLFSQKLEQNHFPLFLSAYAHLENQQAVIVKQSQMERGRRIL